MIRRTEIPGTEWTSGEFTISATEEQRKQDERRLRGRQTREETGVETTDEEDLIATLPYPHPRTPPTRPPEVPSPTP